MLPLWTRLILRRGRRVSKDEAARGPHASRRRHQSASKTRVNALKAASSAWGGASARRRRGTAITIARRKCAANVRLCRRPVLFLFGPVIRAAAGRETRWRRRRFLVLLRRLSANARVSVV